MEIGNYRYAVVNDSGRIEYVLTASYRHVPVSIEVDDATHYFDNDTEQIEPKSAYDYAFLVDGLSVTIQGLPDGITTSIAGIQDVASNGQVRAEFDRPGIYNVWLQGGIRYLDYEFDVEVGE